jgi:hypothetical protein
MPAKPRYPRQTLHRVAPRAAHGWQNRAMRGKSCTRLETPRAMWGFPRRHPTASL